MRAAEQALGFSSFHIGVIMSTFLRFQSLGEREVKWRARLCMSGTLVFCRKIFFGCEFADSTILVR